MFGNKESNPACENPATAMKNVFFTQAFDGPGLMYGKRYSVPHSWTRAT